MQFHAALLFGLSGCLLVWASGVSSTECGCSGVTAESFSDGGNCVVIESGSGYCTLDWRQGVANPYTDAAAIDRAELGATEYRTYSLDHLPTNSPLGQSTTWAYFDEFALEVQSKAATQTAATYFSETEPLKYDESLLLSSIATLLGSAADSQDAETTDFILSYISENAELILTRMAEKEKGEPSSVSFRGGTVLDSSSRGCFEMKWFPSADSAQFDLRVVVKTAFAPLGTGC